MKKKEIYNIISPYKIRSTLSCQNNTEPKLFNFNANHIPVSEPLTSWANSLIIRHFSKHLYLLLQLFMWKRDSWRFILALNGKFRGIFISTLLNREMECTYVTWPSSVFFNKKKLRPSAQMIDSIDSLS